MGKMPLLFVLLFPALCASGASAQIAAGEKTATLTLGAGRIGGHDRSLYNDGFFASGEYLFYPSSGLGYGGEISLHTPESTTTDVAGTGVKTQLRSRFLSALATGRWNVTPQRRSTPYVAAGVGLAQHVIRQSWSTGSEAQEDFWRWTGVVRIGWACLHGKGIAGADLRYQYLDSLTQTYGAGIRLCWRY